MQVAHVGTQREVAHLVHRERWRTWYRERWRIYSTVRGGVPGAQIEVAHLVHREGKGVQVTGTPPFTLGGRLDSTANACRVQDGRPWGTLDTKSAWGHRGGSQARGYGT